MPLAWPGISNVGGDITGEDQQALRRLLNDFADAVTPLMTQAGFQPHASPLWRPWNLIVVRDSEKVLAAFTPLQGGVSMIRWIDHPAIKCPRHRWSLPSQTSWECPFLRW